MTVNLPRTGKTAFSTIALAIIILLSLFVRAYTVSLNLPYFYEEDEAHHFNRTVNMVKNADLNPYYFHKPSLHFYLRMPVVVLSYWWNKHEGHISSLSEIRTRDEFGVADYAFTSSHPSIVKWNRAFSLALSLLIIILTFLIAFEVSGSHLVSLGAAAATAFSPPLIEYSGTVGVDIPMTLMALISVYFALHLSKTGAQKYLWAATIFAGLAVSCKYNAAPIVAVPLAACYACDKLTWKNFLYCAVIPVVSFVAASPYLLVSLPLFYEHVKYEVWHYAVAGHEGHSATPGLGQLIFYSDWYYNAAVGPVIALCSPAG